MTVVSLQDSAGRIGEVMAEQTARLQELRRQLSSGVGLRADSQPDLVVELQAVQEELRLALRREKENQELSRSQAALVESLSRTLHVKEELVRVSRRERGHTDAAVAQHATGKRVCVLQDFQRQLVEPAALPLVERLTQEVQELRESLVPQGLPPRGHILGGGQANSQQPELGGGHQRSMGQYP